MSETIQFTCPACDGVLVVATSLRGTKVSCPKCHNIAVISAPPADFVLSEKVPPESASTRAKLVASIANYGQRSRRAGNFRCPFCQSNLAPKVKRKISTAGWVTFALLLVFCFPLSIIGLFLRAGWVTFALLLVFCFPLSIIGLFLKDEYRVCRSCGNRLH
jgi:DNA-directed RNA polymerase subunit M/transcription elongation factor TFIIS